MEVKSKLKPQTRNPINQTINKLHNQAKTNINTEIPGFLLLVFILDYMVFHN